MNSITTALALVFSVGLLTGCSGQKKAPTTDPALELAGVVDLEECTEAQKRNLDPGPGITLAGNNPNDVGGGLCVHTDEDGAIENEIQTSFERLRDMAVRGNRGSCKWAHTEGSGQNAVQQLWYCSPLNVAEEETGS